MYKLMITGHRKIPRPDAVALELLEIVKVQLNAHPDLVLISGMALGADMIFARIAHKLGIPLHAYIPSPQQADRWSTTQRGVYNVLLEYAETIDITNDHYTNAAYLMRNSGMVEAADACVAVWDGTARSGTGNAVASARRKGIDVTVVSP